jgi:hypothetical protein
MAATYSVLPKLRVLVIGDVHYPETRADFPVDRRDASFPAEVDAKITPPPRLISLARAAALANPAATIVLGDVTSWAQMPDYHDGLSMLRDTLAWSAADIDRVHIAIGNHDIQRDLYAPNKQYDDIMKTVESVVGAQILPVNAPRNTSVSDGAEAKALLISIDSCVGAGARRGIHPVLLQRLQECVPEHVINILANLDTKTVTETLDMPAFQHAHMEAVQSMIRAADSNSACIIASHHNLLPQSVPREDIYTELLNAGWFRTMLSSMNRPIVYVHGHVHTDGVEIIESPHSGSQSRVICVSVGRLIDGFTVLSITFGANSMPLGMVVAEHAPGPGGSVEIRRERRVLLRRVTVDELASEYIEVLRMLEVDKFVTATEISRATTLTCDEVNMIAEELEWFGLIQLQQRPSLRGLRPESWLRSFSHV